MIPARFFSSLITTACLLTAAMPAVSAQIERRWKSTLEAPVGIPPLDVQMLFGLHADLRNHPASVFDASTECSATLVGPRVVLTAAHCTEGDDHIFFERAGQRYGAFCRRFSGRDVPRGTGDWALCSVERETGVERVCTFETLSQDTALIQVGEPVLLTGFGFTDKLPAPGTFNTGAATVTEIPTATSDEIVTEGATTTQGDSGSAVYMLTASGQRRIVGVNSHRTDVTPRTSSASSISTPRAIEFIKAWMSDHPSLSVCGYTPGASNCQP